VDQHAAVDEMKEGGEGGGRHGGRMKLIFTVAFPPHFLLEKELGRIYLKLGMGNSALQMFEKLEMWSEIILCYNMMGRPKKVPNFVAQSKKA